MTDQSELPFRYVELRYIEAGELERLREAEASCAAMRAALAWIRNWVEHCDETMVAPADAMAVLDTALASDAGKRLFSELASLRERVADLEPDSED